MMGGGAALLLLLVPVGRVTVTFPPRAELVLGCPAHTLNASANIYPCDPIHPYAFDVDMRLEICGVVCDFRSGNTSLNLTHAESYMVHVRDARRDSTEVFTYPLHLDDLPLDSALLDQHSKRLIIDSQRYQTAVRRVSQSSLFFPTFEMYGLNCESSDENSTDIVCSFGNSDVSNDTKKLDDVRKEFNFMAKVVPLMKTSSDENDRTLALSLKSDHRYLKTFGIEALSEDETLKRLASMTKKEKMDIKLSNATCSDFFGDQEQELSVEIFFKGSSVPPASDSQKISAASCTPQCLVSTPREGLCSNLKEEVELDPVLTFWSYMAVRVFIGIIGGTAFAMFEGAVIAILREHEGDYGLQRTYGSIGGMISSPLSGMLIDYASKDKGYTDFRPAFYLYAVLKVLGGILMMTINLEFKSPAANLMKDFLFVLKDAELVALFVACFVMGAIWGYIESFLFWLLQDLGASRSLMGVTITVGGIAGIPLLVLSGPIIQRMGHANVIFIAFIFYAIRLLGYSMIYNPWMCLIFEALEGVTSSLAFTAAVTYAARLSTTTTDSSIQGLLGGIYFGVGKGAGSLSGGYLMKAFGTRNTYRLFAGLAVVIGCVYYLFNKMYLMKRPRREGNDICKKSIKSNKTEIPDITINKGNEKLPLKDKTTSLYSEGAPNKNGVGNIYHIGDEKDERTIYSRESSRARQSKDGGSIYGLDNPSFVDAVEPPSGKITQRNSSEPVQVEMNNVDFNDRVRERSNKNSEKK